MIYLPCVQCSHLNPPPNLTPPSVLHHSLAQNPSSSLAAGANPIANSMASALVPAGRGDSTGGSICGNRQPPDASICLLDAINRCCIIEGPRRLHIATTSGATLTYCANGINRVIRAVAGAGGGDNIVVDTIYDDNVITSSSPRPYPCRA